MEAALRTAVELVTGEVAPEVDYTEVRGTEGITEAVYHVGGMDVKVAAVSGLGLMVGLALEEGVPAAGVRAACEQQGLLVLTAKTRLRLLPPLILTQEDVDKALAILRTVLEKL